MPSRELNAVVLQRTEVASGLLILRVVPDGWDIPSFQSGQFVTLGLPGKAPRTPFSDSEGVSPDSEKLIMRAYSVASSSVESQYLEFYIALVRSGSLTPRLFALQPGDRLWMNQRMTGMFTLKDIPSDQNLVFVATGTGLAPYMSMLRTHLNDDSQRQFAVLLGARHSWDLGYQSELITMQRLSNRLVFQSIIDEPDAEPVPWKGAVGRVQDLWQCDQIEKSWGFRPVPDNTHVFLCGNPDMVRDMIALLDGQGFREHSRKNPGQVHTEKYW